MTGSRIAELSRALAATKLSELDCAIWFGVSRATLERIEAGEVVPGPEIEARIELFIQTCGGGFDSLYPAAFDGRSPGRGCDPKSGRDRGTVPPASCDQA